MKEIISKYSIVALDTVIFIYHFEKSKTYFKLTKEIFSRLDENQDFSAITSILTLLEVSVKPIEDSRNDLLKEYSDKLLYDDKLTTLMIERDVAIKAAELRAKYRIRTPDAIQIATSIIGNAGAFITNDIALKKVKEIVVLILDDFL
ncbi:MAG: type II toxin-antitoxin system VapC family toxin [Deltaproteobacteria bacterium]|jgi:predicted nucleic acid-binding protein|nr:type II toxin-antitoxin system VapC family toxin [Deltaproteobacteria bacterium]